jgi:hypothetical protein
MTPQARTRTSALAALPEPRPQRVVDLPEHAICGEYEALVRIEEDRSFEATFPGLRAASSPSGWISTAANCWRSGSAPTFRSHFVRSSRFRRLSVMARPRARRRCRPSGWVSPSVDLLGRTRPGTRLRSNAAGRRVHSSRGRVRLRPGLDRLGGGHYLVTEIHNCEYPDRDVRFDDSSAHFWPRSAQSSHRTHAGRPVSMGKAPRSRMNPKAEAREDGSVTSSAQLLVPRSAFEAPTYTDG